MPIPTHFHLVNLSELDILGLQLIFEPDRHAIQSCTVTRERGSLIIEAPVTTVIIGNLYPKESLDLYILPSDETFILSDTELLSLISIDENYSEFQPTGNLAELIGTGDDNFSDN